MTPEGLFNWYSSCIARASIDYIPYWKDGAKKHLLFCAYNSVWLSQVVWPDWDMFQTHDPYAVLHAVARAVSGGPVYITDRPEDSNPEIARRLAFSDGRLPLPEFPALPTRDILFRDPYNERIPLKIYTHIKVPNLGIVGVVAAFNINSEGAPVEVELGPSDALLPEEKEYVIFEYFTRRLWSIKGNERRSLMTLEELKPALFFIVPKASGGSITPIGLLDVYLSPAGIEYVSLEGRPRVMALIEPGLLAMYTTEKPEKVISNGKECVQVKGEPRPGEYSLRDDGLLLANVTGRVVMVF